MATDSPPPPPGPDLVDSLRALRRSRDNRVVAGVCAGAARQLGVDPLLLRLVVAVLALFGGVGVVLYAAGWLLVPNEDAPVSLAEQAIGRGPSRAGTGTVVLAVVLGVVVVAALVDGFGGFQWGLLMALAIVGFLLLLQRSRQLGGEPPRVSPTPSTPGAPMTSPPSPEAATRPLPSYAAGPALGAGAPPPAPPGPAWQAVPPPPPPPRRRRERSALFGITASAAVLLLGGLGLLDVAGASIAGSAYWAGALAVVGLGLVAGAWVGRSRLLIVAGFVLALGLVSSVAVRAVPDSVTVDRSPASLAAGETHDYSSGSVRYDLRKIDFSDRADSLAVNLGVGDLTVVVPRDVDVTVDASSGIGEVVAFSRTADGVGNRVRLTDLGADGTGGGTLRLELSNGIGSVEVRRG